MKAKVVLTTLVVLSLAGIFSLSACTGDFGYDNNRFSRLLNLLPADAIEDAGILLIDYKRMWDAMGIPVDISTTGNMTREDLIRSLHKVNREHYQQDIFYSNLAVEGSFWSPTISTENVGFQITQVEAEIQVIRPDTVWNSQGTIWLYVLGQLSSQRGQTAALGNFDPAMTVDAMSNQSEWQTHVEENFKPDNYYGTIIYNWNEFDTSSVEGFQPPNFNMRRSAQCKPFAVTNNYLLIGDSTEEIKGMMDSAANRIDSVADIREYALAGQALFDLDAFFGIITDVKFTRVFGSFLDYEEHPDNMLKKFTTMAAGLGMDENGEYLALVYVHDTLSLAAENVARLKRTIDEMSFPHVIQVEDSYERVWVPLNKIIIDSEIRTNGRLLVAKLHLNYGHNWAFLALEQGGLFVHETE